MPRLAALLLLTACAKPVCVQVHEHTVDLAQRSDDVDSAALADLRTDAARDEAVGFCEKRLSEDERQCLLEAGRYTHVRSCLRDYKRRVCVQAVDHVLALMGRELDRPDIVESFRAKAERAVNSCVEDSTFESLDCMLAATTMETLQACAKNAPASPKPME